MGNSTSSNSEKSDKKQFDNLTTRNWWDEIKTIQVPFDEWENLHIGNVKHFVKKYSIN
jgi:hypothetical protein